MKTGDDNSKEAFTKVENVTHINKIKEVRKKNNMTQQEFANSLGISRPHLSKIESSKENASDSVIKLISKLYDVAMIGLHLLTKLAQMKLLPIQNIVKKS